MIKAFVKKPVKVQAVQCKPDIFEKTYEEVKQ